MLAHHGDAKMPGLLERFISSGGMWQVKRHVLPIAADVNRNFYAFEQREQVTVFPPGITKGMLGGDCARGHPKDVDRDGG